MKKKKCLIKGGKGRRLLALTLSIVMALPLAACGDKEGAETTTAEPAKEFTYVPEYIPFAGEESNYGNITFLEDSLVYNEYIWNSETAESTQLVKKYMLADGTTTEIPLEMEENQNLSSMTVDGEKNFYFLLSSYSETTQTFLKKTDAQGNVLLEQEVTDLFMKDGEELWPQSMSVDKEGNLYVATNDGVLLIDASGAGAGMITVDNGWLSFLVSGADGKVYMIYYDQSSARGGMSLAEADFSGRKIGQKFENLPGDGLRSICGGAEGTFLLNDGISVYKYDMTSQEAEELFTWLDSDINGDYVESMAMAEDGKVLAVIRDWGTNVTELAKLTKTKSSELPQKEQIVFGTLYTDQEVQAAAVAFNKKSDKYHVSIKSYIDPTNWNENSYTDAIAKLNNDLTSAGNCPDILDLGQLNEAQFAAKGLFEDLYPYLKNSSVLSEEDFVDGILDQFTRDGKLLSIPKTFNLNTVAGKTSLVGEQMGWTLDEVMAFAKEHPDAALLDGMEKSGALYFCMIFNQDYFVDWEKGECHFDTDEFKSMLEFANMFPKEVDWSNYNEGDRVENLQSDKVLLDQVNISQIEDIQLAAARFDSDVTYIGYPVTDGGVGCMLNAGSRYGMTSKSQHKDGAWAFIESYMTDNASKMFSWGFSTLKEEFQKSIDEAIKRNEPAEEGDTMAMGMSSVSMDGWEYTYHQPTNEEIAQVQELISAARVSSSTNDEIYKIIQEEAEPYFDGQKSVDEVAGVIQSRAQIYVSENS